MTDETVAYMGWSLSAQEQIDGFRREVWELKAENAKLRELLAGDETQRRIAGIGEGTVPTYHGTDTVDEARLVVENAKLRELAHLVAVAEYTSVDQCDGCVAKRACNAGELDMCWIRKAILEKLRELGVEMDGGTE